jgi:DNA-binding transcriptional LysR family regulator
MFERLPSGYRLTDAGKKVLAFAEQMEASLNKMETRVFGRDQRVRGLLRVALPPTVATHLLTAFESGQYVAPDCDTAIMANRESLICSIGRRPM